MSSKPDRVPPLPVFFEYTPAFMKDWKAAKMSGWRKLDDAKRAMMILIGGEQLPPEYKDHPLKGDFKDFNGPHVQGDLILVYRTETRGNAKVITFARLNTHEALYGN